MAEVELLGVQLTVHRQGDGAGVAKLDLVRQAGSGENNCETLMHHTGKKRTKMDIYPPDNFAKENPWATTVPQNGIKLCVEPLGCVDGDL